MTPEAQHVDFDQRFESLSEQQRGEVQTVMDDIRMACVEVLPLAEVEALIDDSRAKIEQALGELPAEMSDQLDAYRELIVLIHQQRDYLVRSKILSKLSASTLKKNARASVDSVVGSHFPWLRAEDLDILERSFIDHLKSDKPRRSRTRSKKLRKK